MRKTKSGAVSAPKNRICPCPSRVYLWQPPPSAADLFEHLWQLHQIHPPRGKITTIVETVLAEEGRCAYRWTISDTGVGMSEEFLQRIFEPFAQEKNDARSVYQGTGLGMAIVKSLVEKMNGTIRVESRLGEGSTFTVTIPFDIAPPPEQPVRPGGSRPGHPGPAHPPGRGQRAQCRDRGDAPPGRGAEVLIAHDGRQALERFRDTRRRGPLTPSSWM